MFKSINLLINIMAFGFFKFAMRSTSFILTRGDLKSEFKSIKALSTDLPDFEILFVSSILVDKINLIYANRRLKSDNLCFIAINVD
jgi:hypothetical protein